MQLDGDIQPDMMLKRRTETATNALLRALGPDTLLRREETAKALTAAGFPVTKSTLATKATRGGSPPYRLFGRVPLYRWGDALAWAEGQLSPPICSTAERDANAST